MVFPASVFRILIASPSDVMDERDLAVKVIQEWNDLNSAERQVVLLPLRWETHSAPEFGTRPQAVINRQVVDNCDLLIGVFWTRIGSPTGVAEGGTIEEIERAANAGRPVMLYFSQAKQDPERIDLEQLAKLRDFKKKTLPNALIENYSTHVEFKDKLSRQLEMQIRSLLAAGGDSSESQSIAPAVTDIRMHFADLETRKDLGETISISTQFLNLQSYDSIPNYGSPLADAATGALTASVGLLGIANVSRSVVPPAKPNRGYFRQLATYRVLQGYFRPVRFWLKNFGGVGARDVHIDLEFRSEGSGIVLVGKNQLQTSPPSQTENSFTFLSSENYPTSPEALLSRSASYWAAQLDIPALQPQREIAPAPEFLLGASSSCRVSVLARIYADTLPDPVVQRLEIDLVVVDIPVELKDLVPEVAEQP